MEKEILEKFSVKEEIIRGDFVTITNKKLVKICDATDIPTHIVMRGGRKGKRIICKKIT